MTLESEEDVTAADVLGFTQHVPIDDWVKFENLNFPQCDAGYDDEQLHLGTTAPAVLSPVLLRELVWQYWIWGWPTRVDSGDLNCHHPSLYVSTTEKSCGISKPRKIHSESCPTDLCYLHLPKPPLLQGIVSIKAKQETETYSKNKARDLYMNGRKIALTCPSKFLRWS